MALQAQTATIGRAENGFTLILNGWGRQIVLVAKGIDELVGLIRGVEWTAEMPLPPSEQTGSATDLYQPGYPR